MTLIHISEARQFFAGEVQKILASPGAKVGRTVEDPHRLQTIANHGQDSPEEIRRRLIASYEMVTKALSQISADDLELECRHVYQGSFTLAEFLQRFIVGHDKMHVQQVSDLLTGEITD